MYDPTVGRFLEEDPIRFAGGDANLYRYVGNSPMNYVDPTGCISKAAEDLQKALPGILEPLKKAAKGTGKNERGGLIG